MLKIILSDKISGSQKKSNLFWACCNENLSLMWVYLCSGEMQGEPSASPPSNAPAKKNFTRCTFDEFLLHLLDRSKSKTPSLDNDKTRLPPARLSAPAHLKFTPLLCSILVRRYFGKTVLPLAKSTLILQQKQKGWTSLQNLCWCSWLSDRQDSLHCVAILY